MPIQSVPTLCAGYKMELVGASFDAATGDAIQDSQFVGTGLSTEHFDDSVARGFDLGFKNADEEIARKDAYLSLYVKYLLASGEGQRDSVIPSADFSATDDQNETVDFIHASREGEYIDTAYPYGVLIFKAYGDTQAIDFDLNGTPYSIDIDELKESQE